jgi:hypothetical protein
MEPKPVFCLVTAMKCPHCTQFRQDWGEIRRTIESTGLVRIVDIELVSTADVPSAEKYPKDLARYVKWFPTFLLFSGKSWNAASPELASYDGRNQGDLKIDGTIFNGSMDANGNAKYVHRFAPTKDNLINWIQNELKGDALAPSQQLMSLLSPTQSSMGLTREHSRDASTTNPRSPPSSSLTSPTNLSPINPISPSRVHTGTPATPAGTGTFYVPTLGSVCRLHFRPKNKG